MSKTTESLPDTSPLTELVADVLALPATSQRYALARQVPAAFPDRCVIPIEDHSFDIARFARLGHCEIRLLLDDPVPLWSVHWNGRPRHAFSIQLREIDWPRDEGPARFLLLTALYAGGCGMTEVHFLVCDAVAVGLELVDAVCRAARDLKAEVLVFDHGYWSHSRRLYRDIDEADPARLVLADDLGEQIAADLQRFLDRRPEYERYGVPWKRGVLLSGPPGNGKTMCVKALANRLRIDGEPIDCLYVRSLASRDASTHGTIGDVFHRARQHTPCLLVIEDLDALITDDNRSVFLNELDGLERNDGIVTIATTNHPDRLDPALLRRPSRFDRTWRFDLPGEPERLRYLQDWRERVRSRAEVDDVPLRDDALAHLAETTDGFSFAYLQELMVSSLMRWIDDPETLSLAELATHQQLVLRAQMAAAAMEDEEHPDDPPPARRRRRARVR